jgi:hypothetical protein
MNRPALPRSLACSIFLAAISLAFSAPAQTTQSSPTADIDPLWAYAGTWQVTIDHFDTAHSKALHEQTNLRNSCWKDGGYLACNQYVDGVSKVLIVFTYTGKNGLYTSYQIPPLGDEPGKGKLVIEGNTWTFPWQTGEGDKTTLFRVVNVFLTPDKIDFRQEFSTDGTHWTAMAHGIETRAKSN